MESSELNLYIESLATERDPVISEIEQYAKEHNVPIMELVGIEAMLQILRIQNPTKILEIGAAIGYSAIRMANAAKEASIITIERDKERFEKALINIKKSNTEKQIQIFFGDALELIAEISAKGPFDVLFIDAAKGQYKRFFESYEHLLSPNGLIITDNVLFKGLVINEEIENKRIRSLVKKIKAYNRWITSHPDYETVILPVGDGLAISKKRGENQ